MSVFHATRQLKKYRLKTAERFATDLIHRYRIHIEHVIETGPRYYVAEGYFRRKRCLVKICLFTSTVDFLTNEKFQREILFLRFLAHSRHTIVRKAAPHIFASGLTPRAWYIREYIWGTPQNVKDGNICIRDSFFTQKRLRWIVHLFSALQAIPTADLPATFKRLLYHPQFSNQLLAFMKPHWKLIDRLVRPQTSLQLQKYFTLHGNIYNKVSNILVHQEPYGVHFIKQHNDQMRLIDWENIGLGHAVHDYVVLWMRASQHSNWQEALYTAVKKHVVINEFEKQWELEVLIQSVFNVISSHFYPLKHDMRALYRFSRSFILRTLWR
ncbi:MAG: hypothetical protein A2898_05360 [Candidatus Kerfeldbacteria bacterium RIFCSPLOWO2_01_FULL_48_11]|uniref:Aminoglycoside phosphotransferase domain-containing protein n=1 Tax=Candidatus Kerfeldbacteria bacterium RIFCSPLOWO2_01_FULL_48_11 TaxID=1798543 RepID=A0A1G2AZR2_9BACT|nr:MAG: hypothetical protein UY34_C0003G0016 [Parcubacteria group bacterium GW2011_GWA2_48_9]KKW16703.1 MAG: hypothetical protein UY52_C0001G0023 [Parcubacteria group bacterium GW2011_GWC2_49_9]OGY82432.1 MAG: hypothetical protein A2898_05360 [Candidatus Kerfeldbacteria bacterium RIFCSPLOWO2_01_FULL_48_11]HCJ52314.1 hypothetical protein [Candidatus Kerfeldbacteria bacterium]HCM67528.1 hypothetical protein [Candidatus Kerfeldbacteria bacterium]